MQSNMDRLAESEERCQLLQQKIYELEHQFRGMLSEETQQKIAHIDQDFKKLEEYFMRAVEDEKRKIYEGFISEHP